MRLDEQHTGCHYLFSRKQYEKLESQQSFIFNKIIFFFRAQRKNYFKWEKEYVVLERLLISFL